jgi:hypothetical protein
MTLMERVNEDIKTAMKARQQERLDALRITRPQNLLMSYLSLFLMPSA